jgi:hypothetical protein
MAVTTPDNIVTPDDGDDYALVQDLAAMADSVQDAITDWKNYGIGTDAERLALTGSSNPPLKDGLRWYSTDTGVNWQYRDLAWLSDLGGIIDLVPSATQNLSGGSNFTSWSPPGSGGSSVTDGSFFTYSGGGITVLKTGKYRVLARLGVSNASSAAAALYLTVNGDTANPIAQDTVQTHFSYGSMAKMDSAFVPLTASDVLRVRVQAASTTLTYGGPGRSKGEFFVKYLGS